MGGIAEAVMKMCFGNGLGFSYSEKEDMNKIFGYSYAGFILEVADWDNGDEIIGTVTENVIYHTSVTLCRLIPC